MNERSSGDVPDFECDVERGPTIIGLSLAAISGGFIGLTARGEFLAAIAIVLIGCICAYAGWWAKKAVNFGERSCHSWKRLHYHQWQPLPSQSLAETTHIGKTQADMALAEDKQSL